MQKLRILLMANIPWNNAIVAYVIQLGESLIADGHEVSFIVATSSPAHATLTERGIKNVHPVRLRGSNPLVLVNEILKARKIISEFKPDVINTFHNRDQQCAALSSVFGGLKVPVINTRGVHRFPKAHLMNRLLYQSASRHIACADFIANDHLPKLKLSSDDIKLVRPGFSVEKFRESAPTKESARKELGLDPQVPVVGLIGRLTAHKGHRTLLRAIARLDNVSGHEVHILFSGIEYDLRFADLQSLLKELGLNKRVHFFPGKLPDVRVPIQAADVLTVPSDYSEAISRIAIEAMSLGVPVIGSDISSLPEILGEIGLLVPPGNSKALAEAITQMLSDKSLQEQALNEGPKRINDFYNLDTQLNLTKGIYKQACNG